MNLILCGLPRSGKTTVGRLLAQEMHWAFIDTDDLVMQAYVSKTGLPWTCRQISQHEGEAAFRFLETLQINTLKGKENHVISTGGGSLLNRENVITLKGMGSLVYLKANVSDVWQRMQGCVLPSYLDPRDPEKSLQALADFRLTIFERAANVIVDTTDLSPHEIAKVIQKTYIKRSRCNG